MLRVCVCVYGGNYLIRVVYVFYLRGQGTSEKNPPAFVIKTMYKLQEINV